MLPACRRRQKNCATGNSSPNPPCGNIWTKPTKRSCRAMNASRNALLVTILLVCICGCDQQTKSVSAKPVSSRQQAVERCAALVSQNQFQEGAACLQPFEQDAKPDQQTAEAAFQLAQ